jgi:hypothetical protein
MSAVMGLVVEQIHRYNYEVIYNKGENTPHAHILSRLQKSRGGHNVARELHAA